MSDDRVSEIAFERFMRELAALKKTLMFRIKMHKERADALQAKCTRLEAENIALKALASDKTSVSLHANGKAPYG